MAAEATDRMRAREGRASGGIALDRDLYRTVSIAILAMVAMAAIWFALQANWYNAAALAGLAALGAGFIAARDRLPTIFTLLFVLAGLVNMAGYLFNLWKQPLWFDEAVHAFTSFAVMSAIGWILLARSSVNVEGRSLAFALSVAGIGFVVGLAWEAFEWIIGIIGPPPDTLMDLIMDVIGALAAGLFCAWAGVAQRAALGERG